MPVVCCRRNHIAAVTFSQASTFSLRRSTVARRKGRVGHTKQQYQIQSQFALRVLRVRARGRVIGVDKMLCYPIHFLTVVTREWPPCDRDCFWSHRSGCTYMSVSYNLETLRLACSLVAASFPAVYLLHKLRSRQKRSGTVKPDDERVLVLGASSGVGRAVAKQYAARGTRVCVVARSSDSISQLSKECGDRCIWVDADFTKVEDMVRVRERIQKGALFQCTLALCHAKRYHRMGRPRYLTCLRRSICAPTSNGSDWSGIP